MNEELTVVPMTFDLTNSLSKVWDNSDKILSLDNLVHEAELISNSCLTLAEEANDALQEPLSLSIEEKYRHHHVVFDWMDEVKHFMIAWRDIVFEQYKGNALLYDNNIDKDTLLFFKEESKISIDKVAFDLVTKLDACKIKPEQITSRINRELRQQANLKNPYDIYVKQIQDLAKQCRDCNMSSALLQKEQDSFHHIRKLLDANIQDIQTQVKHLEKTLQDLVADLEKPLKSPLKKHLEIVIDAENQVNFDNLQTDFNTKLDGLIEQLSEKLNVPIQVSIGTMVKRELGLQRLVKRWLESEVKPLLYEIWEIRDRLTTGGKLIFLNLKNQLNILMAQKKNNDVAGHNTVSTDLITDSFLIQMKEQIKELENLSQHLIERLDDNFHLSNIFDATQHFLPLPAQASINQLIFKQNNIQTFFKDSWDNIRHFVQEYQLPLKQHKQLSLSEQVVRYIIHKKSNTKDEYYQNIFLTKGYIGEAFWVGREDKIERVNQVVKNWKNGFRGAILLTGKRLSGKSLFGEIIVNRYFSNRTIHLFPNSKVKIGRQTIKTTYDLGEALQMIKTQTKGQPYCLWIDNLEMWWDVDNPASKNIRELKYFMDSNCQQLFFIIATSDSYKAHVSKAQEFYKIFQAEITLGDFPFVELEKAISIRHGATHKTLIDNEGLPLSSQQFRKIVKRIHKEANGNIGEALFLWSNAIQAVKGNDVKCNFQANLAFPDILNASTATLLTSIALQKRTNEYRLNKLFGPAYHSKYASLVKRLQGIGVLTKKIDGWIEINELIIHEIINILKRKKYLL